MSSIPTDSKHRQIKCDRAHNHILLVVSRKMAFSTRKRFGKFRAPRLPQKLPLPKRRARKSAERDAAVADPNVLDAETTPPRRRTATPTFRRRESAADVVDAVAPGNEDPETRCDVEAAEEERDEEERDADRTGANGDSTDFAKAPEEGEGEADSAALGSDPKNIDVRPEESVVSAGGGNLDVARSRSCTLPRRSQALPRALRIARSLPAAWTNVEAVTPADIPRELKACGDEADAAAGPADNVGGVDSLGKNTFESLSFSWDLGLKQSCSTMTDTVFSESVPEEFLRSYSYGTSGASLSDATSLYLDLARSLDDRLNEIAHRGASLAATVSEGLENVDVKSFYEEAVSNAGEELARVRRDLRESANMSAKELAVGMSLATALGSDRIKSEKLIEFIVAKYVRAASDLASRFESNAKEMILFSTTRMIEHLQSLNSYVDRCNQIGNSMKKDAFDLINSLTDKVVEEEGYEVFDTSLAHFPHKHLSIRESRPIGGYKVYLKTTESGDAASVVGSNAPTPDYSQILERRADKAANDIASSISKAAEFGSEKVGKFKRMADSTTMNYYGRASDMVGRINCSLKEMVKQSAAEMNDHCESFRHFTKETTDEFIDRFTNTTVDEKGYEIMMSTVADYSVDSIPAESRALGGPKYYVKARRGEARIVSFASDRR